MNKTVFAVALASAAGWALAQAPGAFTPPTFDGLDTDKNGSLSQEEVARFVATIPAGGPNPAPNAADVFGRWDTNKDGSVSRQEFDVRPRPTGPGR